MSGHQYQFTEFYQVYQSKLGLVHLISAVIKKMKIVLRGAESIDKWQLM